MGLISDLVTARTGLFARLGKLFGIIDRVEDFQADIIDNATKSFQEALNEYITATDATNNVHLEYVSGLTQGHDNLRNSVGQSVLPRVMGSAHATLINMVNDEVPLRNKTIRDALFELRRLMAAGSKSLDHSTITIGSTTRVVGASTNGTVVVSALADKTYHSTMTDYPTARTELMTFTCMKDATSKGIVKGGEAFEIRGQETFAPHDHRWPGGSGSVGVYASTSELLADGDSPGRNILRNSGFENFDSSGKSPGWEISVGSAGATVLANSSDPAHGAKCLQLRSDGTNNLFLRQQIDSKSATGTMGRVDYDGHYVISFLMNRANTSPSAGELTVGLMQADGTAVTGSTTAIAHGSIGTSYAQFTFAFRAGGGSALPDPLYFGIRQSTAFTSGTYLNIDRLVMTKMIPTARAGVACAVLPGTTDFKLGDQFTVQVTNNGEGEMIKYLDRCFDLHGKGIIPPTHAGGSETVADTLIS